MRSLEALAHKSGLPVAIIRDALYIEQEATSALSIGDLHRLWVAMGMSTGHFLDLLPAGGSCPALPLIKQVIETNKNSLQSIEDECGWGLSNMLEVEASQAYCLDALSDIADFFGLSLRALASEMAFGTHPNHPPIRQSPP
jgi:hypothetical protein